jgi:nicotinamidase-related amidase
LHESHGLIVVDLNYGGLFFREEDVLTRQTTDEWEYYQRERDDRVLPRTSNVLAYFRKIEKPIVFVSFSYQSPYGLDLDPKLRADLIEHNRWWAIPPFDSQGGRMPSVIAPLKDEPLICKTSWDAFTSSNLDFVLRNLAITDLWFCGALTSGCVRATATQARQRDYRTHVIPDCCLDWSETAHRRALQETGYVRSVLSDELVHQDHLR